MSKGDYVIPLDATMPFPVTTVGWIDGGVNKYYFKWYEIPIYLRFTLK